MNTQPTGYKIKIEPYDNPDEIQKRLFKMGYRWSTGATVISNDFKYLYLTLPKKRLTYGNMESTFKARNQRFVEIRLLHPKQIEFLKSLVAFNVTEIINNGFYFVDDRNRLNALLDDNTGQLSR